MFKRKWAEDETLGETHHFTQQGEKMTPVENPEKEFRDAEGEPGKSES